MMIRIPVDGSEISDLLERLPQAFEAAVALAETTSSVTITLEMLDDDDGGVARCYWAALPTREWTDRREARDWPHPARWVQPQYVLLPSMADGFRPTNHI